MILPVFKRAYCYRRNKLRSIHPTVSVLLEAKYSPSDNFILEIILNPRYPSIFLAPNSVNTVDAR
jgi:hypothetical protein